MEFQIGDVIKMKKPHPCGSSEWEISEGRHGFSAEMYGLRTSGDGVQEARGEEFQGYVKKACG